MRLMTHHPRHYPDKGALMQQAERDMLFAESLKVLEYYRLGNIEKSVQGKPIPVDLISEIQFADISGKAICGT